MAQTVTGKALRGAIMHKVEKELYKLAINHVKKNHVHHIDPSKIQKFQK